VYPKKQGPESSSLKKRRRPKLGGLDCSNENTASYCKAF
jgi:hypothetical protein